ncbi:hypothetical protein BGX23_005974, partial [Mortierella sp. AD031]
SSSTLRQILSSSPKLRILITSDDKLHAQPWNQYLEAEDFVDADELHGQSWSPYLEAEDFIDADKLHVQPRIPYLEAEDFVDAHRGTLNPWACETSVKVLKTKITRILRPNATKVLDGRQR